MFLTVFSMRGMRKVLSYLMPVSARAMTSLFFSTVWNDRSCIGTVIFSATYGLYQHVILSKVLCTKKVFVALEADKTLSERLKETFCTNKNIKIKNQDFLQYKLPTDDFDVVANIPFNITTEVIKKITQETKLKTAILIMQKEAGLRFVGLPNEKSSLISNILQINYDLNFLTKISRNEFTPKPKVDACIISIKRKDKNEDTDERWFKDFLTVVFTKAKPLLKDALKSVFTKVQINNICTKNKIKPNTHIRSITFTQWVSLFNVFETHS